MYLKGSDVNCLKWHGFPSCPLIAPLNRWNLGPPTCLVPKHLQIRKVEHPKHNAFQRFRRDLRSTSGRLEFLWEPMLFHTCLDPLLPPSCVAAGWIYVYIDTNIQREREIQLKLLSHDLMLYMCTACATTVVGRFLYHCPYMWDTNLPTTVSLPQSMKTGTSWKG